MPPKVLLLDGGLGTSLEQLYGVSFGHEPTPLWSSHLLVDDPHQLLLRCQKDFGRLPVDILLTATYQVSAGGFARTRTASWPDGIARHHIGSFLDDAVRLAASAKDPRAQIALSLGPYGATTVPSAEYSGQYGPGCGTQAWLRTWHLDRLQLFAAVPDLPLRIGYIAFETVPRLDEVRALRQALAAVPSISSIPFWISGLFPGPEDWMKLPDGGDPEEAVEAMLDPAVAAVQPWGIGVNCTAVGKLPRLLRRYESAVALMLRRGLIQAWPALVLYPDGTAGEVYNTSTQAWEPAPKESRERDGQEPPAPWEQQLVDIVQETRRRGHWRQIVAGGCCRVQPRQIGRLRRLLEAKGLS